MIEKSPTSSSCEANYSSWPTNLCWVLLGLSRVPYLAGKPQWCGWSPFLCTLFSENDPPRPCCVAVVGFIVLFTCSQNLRCQIRSFSTWFYLFKVFVFMPEYPHSHDWHSSLQLHLWSSFWEVNAIWSFTTHLFFPCWDSNLIKWLVWIWDAMQPTASQLGRFKRGRSLRGSGGCSLLLYQFFILSGRRRENSFFVQCLLGPQELYCFLRFFWIK